MHATTPLAMDAVPPMDGTPQLPAVWMKVKDEEEILGAEMDLLAESLLGIFVNGNQGNAWGLLPLASSRGEHKSSYLMKAFISLRFNVLYFNLERGQS